VRRAAHICAAHTKAGEILVSSTLKRCTESDRNFRFEHLGEHYRGLLDEHAVYTALSGSPPAARLTPGPTTPKLPP